MNLQEESRGVDVDCSREKVVDDGKYDGIHPRSEGNDGIDDTNTSHTDTGPECCGGVPVEDGGTEVSRKRKAMGTWQRGRRNERHALRLDSTRHGPAT